jgi:heparosan-N-sulfate-glucuronate 5-epimerase
MSSQIKNTSFWRAFPLIDFINSEWRVWQEERTKPCYRLAAMPHNALELLPYPIDMRPLLTLPFGALDEAGVPYNASSKKYPAAYHPTTIAQYALAHWNTYLETGDEKNKQAFIVQARWLVENETSSNSDVGGWPFPFSVPDFFAQAPWLSALTQGNAISVLVRAFQLTAEDAFLEVARRAVRTFELDIFDGGVSAHIGDGDIFFEEVAVYPAAHILNGYLLALFGLYDYVTFTKDAQINELIQSSLITLHKLIDRFDTGYWSRYDLLFGHLASHFYHTLHVTLLEALAQYSGCEHCATLAKRWAAYQQSFRGRLYYFIFSRVNRYRRQLRRFGVRGVLFHILGARKQATPYVHAPITSSTTHPGSIDRKVNK